MFATSSVLKQYEDSPPAAILGHYLTQENSTQAVAMCSSCDIPILTLLINIPSFPLFQL